MILGNGMASRGASAAVTGFPLLAPNLSAAVGDISPLKWLGTVIGIYHATVVGSVSKYSFTSGILRAVTHCNEY